MEQIVNKRKKNYSERAEKFQKLKYIYQFRQLLRINPLLVDYHINRPIYFNFQIPKKAGGYRKILSPNEDLKKIQAKLNIHLQAMYYYAKPKCVHGFVYNPYSGKDKMYIVTNALPHCNKKYVLNMDIKYFFQSVTAKQVKEALVKEPFNMSNEIATVIALLGSYKKCLPTGAPTSPILSNIVCLEMDKQLEELCLKNDIAYTRYADDLSFSSNTRFENEIIDGLRNIITKHGFTLNEKKFRLISSRGKQVVTGLVVNKKVNVDRKFIRNIRAILFSWEKMGIELAAAKHFGARDLATVDVAKFVRRLAGRIEFVGQVRGVNDALYNALKNRMRSNLVVS